MSFYVVLDNFWINHNCIASHVSYECRRNRRNFEFHSILRDERRENQFIEIKTFCRLPSSLMCYK
jgi:hypothetical protein